MSNITAGIGVIGVGGNGPFWSSSSRMIVRLGRRVWLLLCVWLLVVWRRWRLLKLFAVAGGLILVLIVGLRLKLRLRLSLGWVLGSGIVL
jgi:hypothetical protein